MALVVVLFPYKVTDAVLAAVDEPEPLVKKEEPLTYRDDEPPLKKRKITGATPPTQRPSPRPISPPWKKITVEGPTSFVEDGRRKSSRTNTVPLGLQLQSGTRKTRATISKVNDEKQKTTQKNYKFSALSKNQNDATQRRPNSAGKTTASSSTARQVSQSRKHTDFSKSEGAKSVATRGQEIADSRSRKSLTNGDFQGVKGANTTVRTRHHRKHSSSSAAAAPGADPWTMNGHSTPDASPSLPSAHDPSTSPLRRIKFRVNIPKVAVGSPFHLLPRRRFQSFQEWFDKDEEEPHPGQDLLLEGEVGRRASEIVHVRSGFEPGGLLTDESLRLHHPDPDLEDDLSRPEEPPKQFSHYDHLVAHALHFRKLLDREHAHHVRTAKQLASEVVRGTAAKKVVPKTEAELEQERRDLMKMTYRQVEKDIRQAWTVAEEEINKTRLAEWGKEQEALGKEHLNRVLEQHTQMLEARKLHDSDEDDEGDETDENLLSDDSDMTGGGQSDDDESNLSASTVESENEEGHTDEDNDANLTLDELRIKYAAVPKAPTDVRKREDGHLLSTSPVRNAETSSRRAGDEEEQQELDESVMDESDPSIDMDSDITDSSDDENDESEESEDGNGDEEDGLADGGLLGFFGTASRKEIMESVPPTGDVDEDVAMADAQTPEMNTGDASATDNAIPIQSSGITTVVGESTQGQALQEIADQPKTSEMPSDIAPTAGADGSTARTLNNQHDPDPAAEQKSVDNIHTDEIPNDPHASRGASSHASPETLATKESEPDSFSSVDAPAREGSEVTDAKHASTIKTPVPSLLRGTLREYQHYGLDWLARLYAKHTNGILADEMGLGKTIQSIALLAHLAVEYQVWGPHLIVVPTSVMLNWEMEFKKFLPGFKILTYYGSQEERKAKRRGWLDDDLWNVCITSYQLVLQDQVAFKRRNWHYMILDEAHNIKNFRSQRWQTLLGFKTRARLLLTGTPLQNNLTELWSLLFFLQPSDLAEEQEEGFAGLRDFSEWFRKPVTQILEYGRETMDDEAKEQVAKLHKVIRPYLLRRLKADVEKQMPLKYEHVELCRLSKRQRQLYDGFMSRAQTKETLASGNYLSIINCLMQLRKVCNHPDLFETRPITTSFAMPKSTVADFEIKDLLVRRNLMQEEEQSLDLNLLQLAPISRESKSAFELIESSRLTATRRLQALRADHYRRIDWNAGYDGRDTVHILGSMDNAGRKARLVELESTIYSETFKHSSRSIYGRSLIEKLSLTMRHHGLGARPLSRPESMKKEASTAMTMENMILSIDKRANQMVPIVEKFACITPAVVAPLTSNTLTTDGIIAVQDAQKLLPANPFHEAQTRLSIAFPDKRLLQYDCGKLQRLDRLLRQLQAGGHRALIFTQMTKVLDILEQFLNIHGHKYLRLDGATKLEQRQALTERFNNDTRILAFILSSRSGGLGINLTGADTVIFYDLDWNPAMDKQCQDRAHRIGQTRDVHIYRFVSESTIEANILRKSNQKRMLDDVIIQEGDFTTDYFNKMTYRDMLPDEAEGDAEANAAMDRVLGSTGDGAGTALAQAEDAEDATAAKVAEKEIQHADDGDFEDKVQSATPRTGADTPRELNSTIDGAIRAEATIRSLDEYLLRTQAYLLKNAPLPLPVSKSKKKSKKGQEHRIKRVR